MISATCGLKECRHREGAYRQRDHVLTEVWIFHNGIECRLVYNTSINMYNLVYVTFRSDRVCVYYLSMFTSSGGGSSLSGSPLKLA